MRPLMAFSLAWRMATHNAGRLVASIGGIAFAALLMLLQMGFENALLDSSVQLLDRLNADLIVLASTKSSYLEREEIPRERLHQVRGVKGVAAAYPLFLASDLWKNLDTGVMRPIRVVGFDCDFETLLLDDVERSRAALAETGTALMDRRARAYYGTIRAGGPAEAERRTLRILGTFAIGTDFETDGTMIVGKSTFKRLNPDKPKIEFVLARIEPGASLDTVLAAVKAALPKDSVALTKPQLRAREIRHWQTGTPISIVFAIGTFMGFVVGIVICYQILYTDVTDHLTEFATIKAIGFGSGFLVMVVLSEAVVLSLVAYVPSLALGLALYELVARTTGLLLQLTLARGGAVLGLTVLMSVIAGLFALRKVLEADPAEVF